MELVIGSDLFNDLAVVLAFHQPAAHQVRSHHLCRTAEEGQREGGEILGDGSGGYGRGSTTETADWCIRTNIS